MGWVEWRAKGLEYVEGLECFVEVLEYFVEGLECYVEGLEYFVEGLEYLYISVFQVARGVGDVAMLLMPTGERRNQCIWKRVKG